MIKTYGLTHIALKVADPTRSSAFYQKIFGVKEMYKQDDFIQVQTPGSKDIIVFEKADPAALQQENKIHFGFRLQDPADSKNALNAIKEAGGIVKESGDFVPGEPYIFFYDPDGYEVEIWYEKISPSQADFS